MVNEAPLYDLMLLLSTSAEDEQRAKILADVEASISRAGGSIERNDDWGQRPMAYEIRHQPEADYHLLQFRSPPTLIEELSHTLRITDGVLRFRVIKVRPGTPAAPSSPPPVVAAVASSAHSGAGGSSGGGAGGSGTGGGGTGSASEPGRPTEADAGSSNDAGGANGSSGEASAES
jgi:small subunit ribosomal protein S6